MEINLSFKRFQLKILLLIFFSYALLGSSDDSEQKRLRLDALIEAPELIVVEPNDIQINRQTTNSLKDRNLKEPFAGVTLDFSKIFNKDKVLIGSTEFSNFNSGSSANSIKQVFILNPGEYIEITQPDRRNFLFDGSFIIRFQNMPNLEDFARINDIDFLKDFSDVQAGLFKVDNLLDLQIKLDSIQNDRNIISITLNTLDINTKPK
jgi:hypothetical protein